MSNYKITSIHYIELVTYIDAKNLELACAGAKEIFNKQKIDIHNKICEIPYVFKKETSGNIVEIKEVKND